MKWYQKTGWIILLLLVFFPAGCYLMWKYKPQWHKWVKWPVTVVMGIWFLAIAVSSLLPSQAPGSQALSEAPDAAEATSAEIDSQIQAAVDEALAETQALLEQKETELSDTKAALEETQQQLAQAQSELEQTQDELEEARNSRRETSSGTASTDSISESSSSSASFSAASGVANSQTVLVTRTGSKYHTHKCGNGTYYEATLDEAMARGLTPCEKCY